MERAVPGRPTAQGVPQELLRRPLRVFTTADATSVYAHPRGELKRLTDAGLLRRLHDGLYAVVPPGRAGASWSPALEPVAAAVGAALFGADHAVLTGLAAARLHGAVPRALGVATVAVPRHRRPITLAGTSLVVRFTQRDVDRLDAERIVTELGPVLVAGVEQTILDLAHPRFGDPRSLAEREAVTALAPRADPSLLRDLAGQQRLTTALARAASVVDLIRPAAAG